MRIIVLPVFLLLALTPQSAMAWGGTAHRVICDIAFQELEDPTRSKVRALILLNDEFELFSDSRIWPNNPRKQKKKHYTDIVERLLPAIPEMSSCKQGAAPNPISCCVHVASHNEDKLGKVTFVPGPGFLIPFFPPPELVTNVGAAYTETVPDLDLLTFNYTRPADQPPSPGGAMPSLFFGPPHPLAPVISVFTRQAGPDRSFVLHGSDITAGLGTSEDPILWLFGKSGLLQAKSLRHSPTSVTGKVDERLPYGMYLAWVQNGYGISRPVRINATDAWWLGPNHAQPGETVSVYGRNLSKDNGETKSYVYLRPFGSPNAASISANVTGISPFKVTFTVPQTLEAGEYEVWIHNGHGGAYGWSGPLKAEIHAGNRYVWGGKTINVKDIEYGAMGDGVTDDTNAIKLAFANAADGDVVKFPAGTYLFNRTNETKKIVISKSVSIEGDLCIECGGPGSVILVSPESSEAAEFKDGGIFEITGFPSRIRHMRFESLIQRGLPGRSIVLYEGSKLGNPNQTTPEGIIVQYSAFNSPTPDRTNSSCDGIRDFVGLNTAGPEDEMDCAKYRGIWIKSVNDVRITNSKFTSGWAQGIELWRVHQAFIDNNVFMGRWDDVEASGGAAVRSYGSNEVDFSHNRARSVDAANGLRQNRLFVASGHSLGLTSRVFVGENETVEVGAVGQTQGENIAFETPGVLYTGRVLADWPSGQSNSPVFSCVAWPPNLFAEDNPTVYDFYLDRIPSTITIQSGRGAGQYRRILSNDANTLVIDRPWDIAPDPNSVFSIITNAYQSVVYKNSLNGLEEGLSGFASVGVTFYGGAFDVVVSRNNIDTVEYGIYQAMLMGHDVMGRDHWGSSRSFIDPDCVPPVTAVCPLDCSPAPDCEQRQSIYGFHEIPITVQSGVMLANNTIHNARVGIASYSKEIPPQCDVTQPAMLDISVRDNVITGPFDAQDNNLQVGIDVGEDNQGEGLVFGLWQQTTSLEHNQIWNARSAVVLMSAQRDTIIRKNSIASSVNDSYGILFLPQAIDPIVFGNNLFATIGTFYTCGVRFCMDSSQWPCNQCAPGFPALKSE